MIAISGTRLIDIKNKVKEKKIQIINFITKNNKRPSYYSNDPKEKRLYSTMRGYTSITSDSYDDHFSKTLDSLCPKKIEDSNTKKQNILSFIAQNKRKPSAYSKDINEKRLGQAMYNYISEGSKGFNEDFKDQVESLVLIKGSNKND